MLINWALMPRLEELMAETMPAGVVAVEAIAIVCVADVVGAEISAAPLLVERSTTTPLLFVSEV